MRAKEMVPKQCRRCRAESLDVGDSLAMEVGVGILKPAGVMRRAVEDRTVYRIVRLQHHDIVGLERYRRVPHPSEKRPRVPPVIRGRA